VPAKERRIDVVQESAYEGGFLPAFVSSYLPDTLDGDGVDRRLAQTTGVCCRASGDIVLQFQRSAPGK